MSEARPLDHNFGHIGEPLYDSETQKWQYARAPHITRQFRPIGKPLVALESSSERIVTRTQKAVERFHKIKELIHQYPELVPSTPLLPGLAQTSEAVNEVTTVHDPTVSELLAFGTVVDKHGSRSRKPVQIVAIAGGAAGEVVRLVLLTQEHLVWKESKNVFLKNLSARGGKEGRWSGNGSPIQQLVFAESQGQLDSLLAVRYHGAISILRPLLGHKNQNSRSHDTLQSCLDPNHIVTLPIQRARSVPFSDVGFDPWNHHYIASIDQEGHWSVWKIEGLGHQSICCTIAETSGGNIHDGIRNDGEPSQHLGDGWGAVMWAGTSNTLIVAARKTLAIFDVKGTGKRLEVPDLFLWKSTDWILDIKRSASDVRRVFVLTSSTLFWLVFSDTNEVQRPGAQCLLSWRHFRNEADISLRLNVLQLPDNERSDQSAATFLVLLYSRFNGLATVFTFQRSTSSLTPALSVSDPYTLTLPSEENKGSAHPKCISALALRPINYDLDHGRTQSGTGQLLIKNKVEFYQLSVLFNDLLLSECLYAGLAATLNLDVPPPHRSTCKQALKTPMKVVDDFVVPDECEDEESRTFAEKPDVQGQKARGAYARSLIFDDHRRTISFEWLEREMHRFHTASPAIRAFNQVLEHFYDEIKDRLRTELGIMETLLDLESAKTSILDLDKASLDFKDFLEDVSQITLDGEDRKEPSKEKTPIVTVILTPSLKNSLALPDDAKISAVYDSLVGAWISPLPRNIPSRSRIALERSLREIAAQICLASYAVRFESNVGEDEDTPQEKALEAGAQFTLPVRRRVSATNLRKGKEPAARSSSPPASSQISEDVGFLRSTPLRALPTPEPTPSLHSRSSVSSLARSEDPASLRLQAYASLAPQPALPNKLSNLLGQWETGADPAKFNWEAAQHEAFSEDDTEDESRTKQRQHAKRRRKHQRVNTVGPSSQPPPQRLGGSQPQQTQDTQETSQTSERMATTMSQVEPGPFSGRRAKAKKKRRGGF